MAMLVIREQGQRFFRRKIALLWLVALATNLYLKGGMCLDIAIPVGMVAIARDDNTFVCRRIVVNDLQHRLSSTSGLAPNMSHHETPMAEHPAQMPAVQVAWQKKCPLQQPCWPGRYSESIVHRLVPYKMLSVPNNRRPSRPINAFCISTCSITTCTFSLSALPGTNH